MLKQQILDKYIETDIILKMKPIKFLGDSLNASGAIYRVIS